MPEGMNAPSLLLELAAEGVAPVVGGCAGALIAGPVGAAVGAGVGRVVEKAINFFGPRIVEKWLGWFRRQPKNVQVDAVAGLGSVPVEQARQVASEALDRLTPAASPEDKAIALGYIAAIPEVVQQSLVLDLSRGGMTVPPSLSLESPQSLMQLLPQDAPPYAVPTKLPDTDYILKRVIGTGGFGVVYEAEMPALQQLPLAIKFCLDPSMVDMLRHERDNLKALHTSGKDHWSPRIVRLYGYNLKHATPFLVYEYVAGGTLTNYLAKRREEIGGNLTPAEVLGLIKQITEGLAFAHGRGLVHRDLKPANVLVDGETLKLADFGIGGIVAGYAVAHSQIGRSMVNQLHADEQVSLLRGSGTPLYMDPEQRKGGKANAKHDLYSLGIVWYQLLVGDVTREFHGGWDEELVSEYGVPRDHIEVIRKCVGWIPNRPENGGALLELLEGLSAPKKVEPVMPIRAEVAEEMHSLDDLRTVIKHVPPGAEDVVEEMLSLDDLEQGGTMEGEDPGGFSTDNKHPKYAYLVGGSPKGKTVHLLVKVHDWDAKAVYLYDLINGGYKHIAGLREPSLVARWMERAKQNGHQIPHKKNLKVEKWEAWVQYAKGEAARLGLTVAK